MKTLMSNRNLHCFENLYTEVVPALDAWSAPWVIKKIVNFYCNTTLEKYERISNLSGTFPPTTHHGGPPTWSRSF